MRTVFQTFAATAAQYADRPFLHIPAESTKAYQSGPVDQTYAEALRGVEDRRERFAKAGYGSGHRVGLLLANRAEFFLNWLALNALGVSIVPLNHEGTAEDLAYIVGNSGLLMIVTLPDYQSLADAIAVELGPPVPIMLDGEAPPQTELEAAQGTPDAASECGLLYTSGSTGKPKGCMLSNDYFLLLGEWYRDLGGYCELHPGEERLLTPLPLSHMNALATSSMAMIVTGGCIVQLDRFHPRTWWKTVKESGATALHYLGVLPAILLNLPVTDEETDNNVRFGFGAGVNPKHHAPFEERFGFPLIEGWAMTESGVGGCIMAHQEPRHVGTCCFGKAPPWVEYRIVDDADCDVPQGDAGELLVRAAGDDPRRGFFSGYFGMDQATKDAWQGGWLHTGDVVREGPDRSLHFVDRKKSIIRRSGRMFPVWKLKQRL